MKHFTRLLLFILLLHALPSFTQITGDFRSKTSGIWGDSSIWQVYNGTAWANATFGQYPGGTSEINASNVFIEAGHTVTLESDHSCKNLNLNTTADIIRINTQNFNLNVWGKMRFYEGTAPGLGTPVQVSSSGILGWITTGTEGYIRFRGTTNRICMADGEVNSNNSNSGWNLDFAFDNGYTGQINERIRATNITVSSGTLLMNDPTGEFRIGTNNGPSDLTPNGSFVVKSGSTVMGGSGIFKKSTVAASSIIVESGGNLIITQPNFVLAATTLSLEGNVRLQNAINFPTESGRSEASLVNTFANLFLEGTGDKTLQNNVSVTGTLSLGGTSSLNLNSFTLGYGPTAILEYNGSATQTTSSSEFPISNGPENLTINNSKGVVLHENRTINNILNLQQGLLFLENNTLTLGANSPTISGTLTAGNMIVTNGTGTLTKIFSEPGTYFFPVGDTIGIDQLSSVSLSIKDSSVLDVNSRLGIRTISTEHPAVAGSSSHLARYWEVASNMTQFSYNAVFKYDNIDVIGMEPSLTSFVFTDETALSPRTAIDYIDTVLNEIPLSGVNYTGFISAANFGCSITNNTIAAPSPLYHCPKQPVLFDGSVAVVASGNPTYQWQSRINEGSWTNISLNGQSEDYTITDSLQAGSYTYRRIVSDSSFCIAANNNISNEVTISILQTTSVTSHPQNKAICANSNTSFSIEAIGVNLTYHWQASTDGGTNFYYLSNGSLYSNTTTPTLTISNAPTSINNSLYRCVVTGFCSSAISKTATLTINSPSITSQPLSKTVCEGTGTSFNVTSTGVDLSYQWKVSTDGGSQFTNLTETTIYSNVTSASLSLSGITSSMNGYKFKCVVMSGICLDSAVSNTVTLSVNSLATVISHPDNVESCEGASFSISTVGSGTSITYQWQASINGGSSYTNISDGVKFSNTTTSTLSVNAVPSSMNGYLFRCKITGTCSIAYSNPSLLTLSSPIITSNPVNKYICAGTTTTFNVTATGAGLVYQWQESTNNGSSFNNLAGSSVYSNVTTSSLTLTAPTISMNKYQYRCIISGSCGSPMTSSAGILNLYTPVTILSHPGNVTVTSGGSTSLSVSATGTGLSYLWYVSKDGGLNFYKLSNGTVHSNVSTATLNINSVTSGMNNYQYKCRVTGTCAAVYTNAATLSVTSGGARIASSDVDISLSAYAYPNPFNDQVFIVVGETESNATVTVKDMDGRVVFIQENIITNTPVVLGHELNAGIYVVEVKNASELKTIKIIKTE